MSTIRVQRANVILDIRPDEKERYMEQGYSVIDAKSGKVLEAAIPSDPNHLKMMISELKKELLAKDEEIADLKSKLAKKK